MRKIKFDHVFNCSMDVYWDKVFFDEEYNKALFLDTLKFPHWSSEITEDNDDVIKRVVTVRSPVGKDVPAAVRKVLGDSFGYKEFGTFDKKTKRYHVDVESNVATDKTHVHGDIWLEPVDDHHCRRIAEFSIEVKIPFVGGKIEDGIASDMDKEFNVGSRFTNEWLAKKGLDK
jgi:hypothetical protein